VPSKTADFKEDNYPDCPGDTAAHAFDAWWGGQNKNPEMFKFSEDYQHVKKEISDIFVAG